jgi:penicillin-binding protein 1A
VVRRDERACPDCQGISWQGQAVPVLADERPAVIDPARAYQMVNLLHGVVERGTGVRALSIGKPVAGKTGTSNDARDAWFIGFTPDLVVGVYVGFDQPKSLGRNEQGASAALPIFVEIMTAALKDQPATPFRVPPGIRLVRVDAESGLLPGPDTKTVILEAFMPGTEPTTATPPKGATASIAHEVYLSQGSGGTGGAGDNGASQPSAVASPAGPEPARPSAVPRSASPQGEVRSPPPMATGSPNTGGLY